jgi:hypothetical protein
MPPARARLAWGRARGTPPPRGPEGQAGVGLASRTGQAVGPGDEPLPSSTVDGVPGHVVDLARDRLGQEPEADEERAAGHGGVNTHLIANAPAGRKKAQRRRGSSAVSKVKPVADSTDTAFPNTIP